RAEAGQDGALSGGGYDMTVTLLRDIPATLLTSVDNRVLLSDLWQATWVVIAVSCGLGLLLLFAYRWINHEVALPIAALTRFIGSIGQPDALRRVRPTGNRDLRKLGETVNGMLEQQERLTQDLIRTNTNLIASELAARRAELKYLRSQINPHFLYNTLEVVRSIAVVRQVPEIVMAAKSLARILRFSIQGEDVVPLRTELSVIEDYIQIQTLRFRDRIAVRVDVSEEAQELPVPRLCLQPAVENAFVHGLESTLAAGELRISGAVTEDLLRLVIWDNGAGIPPERLDALNRLLAAPEAGAVFESNGQEGRLYETSGIGLANVALRARLLGDERHGVSVASRPG
ncbi:MAG TPA: histidine kinase, partial [Clostridia bacterium]|nr:histidine kinase [Clostridia bacterium]